MKIFLAPSPAGTCEKRDEHHYPWYPSIRSKSMKQCTKARLGSFAIQSCRKMIFSFITCLTLQLYTHLGGYFLMSPSPLNSRFNKSREMYAHIVHDRYLKACVEHLSGRGIMFILHCSKRQN